MVRICLLVIMNDDSEIMEIGYCGSIDHAKREAEKFINTLRGDWQTDNWLGKDDYPYRKADIKDTDNPYVVSVEIVPDDEIEDFTKS